MSTQRQLLQVAIASLEAQRANIGDAAVDAALGPLRARLAVLEEAPDPPAAAQVLRRVSVLFLDVVGSTPLSQRLDPEDLHAVLDGTLAACTRIVESHRGKVLQYAGDALLAVFGADAVHEDDAERAVQAGLALLDEGRRQGEQVQQRHGHAGFHVRVGVHTGEVLLGGGVDAEGSIRGITVHVAARMEQTAPAGALQISHATWQQVRGRFEVEARPPTPVKGLDAPLASYLVTRALPHAFRVGARGIEGVETPMIGRDAELARLQRAHGATLQMRRLRIVTIEAHAGLGKSRLLQEFEAWALQAHSAVPVLRARAQAQTLHQPFGMLRDALARHAGIADSDTMPQARAKFENGIMPLFDTEHDADIAEGHAHVLGHLIGLDFHASRHVQGIAGDGRQLRGRGFHAAAQVLRRLAASSAGLIVLLEDLHWADAGSLDFIDQLGALERDAAVLVVATTRPELIEQRPGWGSDDGVHERIRLEPLGAADADVLAAALLHKLGDVPATLLELVTSESDGNPFYLEEMVKMFVDAGAIRVGAEHWTLDAERLAGTRVPGTLSGVLQARLDRLAAAERLALQHAAVVGHVFWDRALAAIDSRTSAELPALERRGLIVARPHSRIDGAREYTFGHHLLHHVAYDTLLKRQRRDAHARTAAWLEGLAGARVNDFLGLIASHFDQAGLGGQAAEYYTRALENAAARYANDAALRYAERALALAAPGDLTQRWRVLVQRERVLDVLGHRDAQATDLRMMINTAAALDDPALSANAHWRNAHALGERRQHAQSLAEARVALAFASRVGARELELRIQTLVARALYRLGEPGEAVILAQQGLAAARAHGFREPEGLFLNTLSVLAEQQGDVVAGLQWDREHLRICREIGNRRHESNALVNLGNSMLSFGAHDDAARYMNEGLQLARAVGNRSGEANVLFNLAILALRLGDAPAALHHAGASIKLARALQDPEYELWGRMCAGRAHLELGDGRAAEHEFETALELSTTAGGLWKFDILAHLAGAALARDDVDTALHRLAEPLAHLAADAPLDGVDSLPRLLLMGHEALRRRGDARARALLEQAHQHLQARAAGIKDPALRESFLTQIPEHRAIVVAIGSAG